MSQQRRVFLKTWWSPYLGEWRPFHDNYIYAYNTGCTFSGSAVFTLVPPTPSVTPTLTMTPTPSVTTTQTLTPSVTPTKTPQITPSVTPTITNTPSITSSETPTLTPSITPSVTTTVTNTPSPTPSITASETPTLTPSVTTTVTNTNTPSQTSTANPICPQELEITSSSALLIDNGVYTRQTIASGQTFNYGWFDSTAGVVLGKYVLGTAPDGYDYPIYQVYNNGDYNTFARYFYAGSDRGFGVNEQNINPLDTGVVITGSSVYGNYNYLSVGNERYPSNATQVFPLGSPVVTGSCYISYSILCPTPTTTPTPSITPTNTLTPSITPTNTTTTTQTPNPTLTPSATPLFDPSSLGNLQYWFKSTDGASTSSWTNYGLIGGALGQTVAANQPQIITNDIFGSGYTGQSVNFTSRDFMNMSHTASTTTFTGKTFFFVSQVANRDSAGWSINIQNGTGYTAVNNVWDYQFWAGGTSTISRSRPGSRTFNQTSFANTLGPSLYAASGLTTTGFTAALNDVIGTSGTTTYAETIANYINFGYDSGANTNNNISMFEFLGYNKLLTASEFALVLNYLKTKYKY